VVRIVGSGEEVTAGQIPFTAHGKRVLELSLNEALSLGHNYIGTEHILLGLVRENEGVAARILLDFDADAGPKIRTELIRMLSGPEAQKYAEAKPLGGRGTRHSMDQAWFDGLGGVLNGLAREIRREVEREPDTGDLLLALTCASDTLAAQALHELGVKAEGLPEVIERIRTQRPPSAEAQLAQRIEEVRQAKEQAIERLTAWDATRNPRDEPRCWTRAPATCSPTDSPVCRSPQWPRLSRITRIPQV
jgi:ATP-dependent Clp protease ATP-binding subunit ClpA